MSKRPWGYQPRQLPQVVPLSLQKLRDLADSLRVFFVDHGLGQGLLSCQCSATQSYLHHEYAAIGLFHKISNEVAKNLNRRIVTLKMQVCRKPEAQQG